LASCWAVPHRQRGVGHNGAPADLAAAEPGVLDTAVVPPLAGVVHIGLPLLEQLAVAGERVEPFRADHVDVGRLLDVLLAVGPFDREALVLEQAFVVGDKLRQSLERGGGFEDQLLHRSCSWPCGSGED
jgi:hypothetical protein